MTVLYPVARTAESALSAPLGRAAREREARLSAKGEVRFVVEETGPGFPTRQAALDAYGARLDDERGGSTPPEDRFCTLREVLAASAKGRRKPAPRLKPAYKDGRRWPAPPPLPETVWRLSVSYWKRLDADEALALDQARHARRGPQGQSLDGEALRALSRQPMQPVRPQQPLDIGLFEQRAPENPALILPDE